MITSMLWTILWYFALVAAAIKIFNVCTNGSVRSNKCLIGKTVLITGGNSGIGYEAALNLASRGCRLIIASRSANEETCKKIAAATGNDNITAKQLDLASFASIRKFVDEFKRDEGKLDVLINNSGTAGTGAMKTQDGINAVMQTNHYGPFLLTHLLLDLLKQSPNGRIVFTSSLLAFCHDLTPNNLIDPYPKNSSADRISEFHVYGSTKACNLITSNELAKRLSKTTNIIVHSLHPGMVDSPLVEFSFAPNCTRIEMWIAHWFLGWLCKSARKAGEMVVETALRDDQVSGGYFVDNCRFFQPRIAKNEKFVEDLWKTSEKVVKLEQHLKLTR